MSMAIELTDELSKHIVASIRAGGYPHIAAEAFGVPKETFDSWLEQGSREESEQPYRTFACGVREAFAHARLFAEMAELRDNPERWLIHGPGRESEQRPGWSSSVKPSATTPETRNVLTEPEIMRLFRRVLEVLIPFPEARQKVADVLQTEGMNLNEEKSDGAKSVQVNASE